MTADELYRTGSACDEGCCARVRSRAHREPLSSGVWLARPMFEVRDDLAAAALGLDPDDRVERGMTVTAFEYDRPDRIFL